MPARLSLPIDKCIISIVPHWFLMLAVIICDDCMMYSLILGGYFIMVIYNGFIFLFPFMSSLIQQVQKYFVEASDANDSRNVCSRIFFLFISMHAIYRHCQLYLNTKYFSLHVLSLTIVKSTYYVCI